MPQQTKNAPKPLKNQGFGGFGSLFPLDKFLYLELYFQFISRQLTHIFSDFLSTISVYRIS